ncbi:MAG TPA: RHS repeat-associated core domain-containing protein [Oculatellaceae cyanobacterium]
MNTTTINRIFTSCLKFARRMMNSQLKPALSWSSARVPVSSRASARRIKAGGLAVLFLTATSVAPALAADSSVTSAAPPPSAMPKNKARKGELGVKKIAPKNFVASAHTDSDLCASRVLMEPLAPMHTTPVDGENEALAKNLSDFNKDRNVERLDDFLQKFPKSRWYAAVALNVAELLYEQGYFSRSLSLWDEIWKQSKEEKSSLQKHIADEAISRLLVLNGRLGKTEELDRLLTEIKSRPMYGTAELRVHEAKDGLLAQQHRPAKSFKCGPCSINSLLNIGHKTPTLNKIVDKTDSTKNGTNLAQVKDLADKVGLHYQLARRTADVDFEVPAVIHYKQNHFAAVTEKRNGLYHVTDPTFDERGNMWVSAKALCAETDGFALLPDGALPAGWEKLSKTEAANVWGKGFVPNGNPAKPPDAPQGSPCLPCWLKEKFLNSLGLSGMAVASAFMLNASLKVQDTPVGYTPPIGPAIDILVNYNHQEGEQPSTFTFTNLGPDWSVNFVSYLTLDGSKNATVRVPGGGYEIYNYTLPDNIQNPYVPDLLSQAVLTVVSPTEYHRTLPDGSMEIFNQPDGSGRIFMTQLMDPQGNSAYIQYDSNFRLSTITDAIGQVTTFSYLSDTFGNPGFYLVSQITDPYSRSATFAYDATDTYLISITDTIGITSQFSYDTSSSFINSLTTPYGTYSFLTYSFLDNYTDTDTVLKFTMPDGSSSVVRSSFGDNAWQTCYWNREAMQLYPNDYLSRLVPSYPTESYVWQTSASYIAQPVAQSYTRALEPPFYLTYAGQGETADLGHPIPGPLNKPSNVSWGSENSSYVFNALGHMTKSVDPVGRTFSYLYDANNIDLLEARQTRNGNNDLLGKWIYNNDQHLPNKYIDGSGQVTQYAYNAFGQLTTLTDANGNVTTNTYSPDGLLLQTDGPMPGSADSTTFSYDGLNRLYSVTDSQGYTVYFSYDNADRLTLVTYPDGTTEQTVYDKLDAVMQKDRLGRWTQTSYDSMEQPLSVVDPQGRKTQYSWCACGALNSLTDPNGHVTTFQHDLAGRLTTKTLDDTTTIQYGYDAYSNLTYRKDNLGQQTFYAYNLDNTLNTKSYYQNLQPPVYYSWDPNYTRLTSVQNSWGTISYSYNPYITNPFGSATTGGGMLASVSNNVIPNSTITYQYDALGRTTNRSINGSANSVSWNYDAMSRVTSEANALGTFNYNYVDDIPGASKGDGRLASINYPNGQKTKFDYLGVTQDERLLGITNFDPSAKTRSQFNYAYDPVGEITRWSQQNATRSPMRYALDYDRAGQLVAAKASLGGNIKNADQYFYTYDPGSNRTSSQSSTIESISFSGTVTAGDVLTVTVANPQLTGGQEAVSYTVQSADTLSTIAAALANKLTADSNLQSVGINAAASGSILKIKAALTDVTTVSQSVSTGATETLSVGLCSNSVQNLALSLIGPAYQSRSSDVIALSVFDAGLAGGSETVSYTVPSNGASLSSIATGLAAAVNADTNLSGAGVSASAAGACVSLASTSSNLTTYSAAVTPTAGGGTETLSYNGYTSGNASANLGGTASTGDIVNLTVRSPRLSNGQEIVQYAVPASSTLTSIASGLSSVMNADSALASLGLSANATGSSIAISTSPTYSGSTSSGATETITLGTTTNGNVAAAVGGTVTAGDVLSIQTSGGGLSSPVTASYTVLSGDTLGTVAAGLAAALAGNTSLKSIGVGALSSNSTVNVSYTPSNPPVYLSSVTGGAPEVATLSMNNNVDEQVRVGGAVTAGDALSLVIYDQGLAGGSTTVNYTVSSSDSLFSIASNLAAAVNSNSNAQAIGVSATASGAVINLVSNSLNTTKYGPGGSAGATEYLMVGINPNGTQTAAIGGSATVGDVLSIKVIDAGLSGGGESVSYTVATGDTLSSIAAGIATAINGDSSLSAIGVNASSNSAVVNIRSASVNATTYSQSANSGATETIALAASTGVLSDTYNSVNELVQRAAGGAVKFAGSTNKASENVRANTPVVNIAYRQPSETITYSVNEISDAIEYSGLSQYGDAQFVIRYVDLGYDYQVTVFSDTLPGGQTQFNYTPTRSDTELSIATYFANQISSNVGLQALGLQALAVQTVGTPTVASITSVSVFRVNPTYAPATSSGATESVTVGPTALGNSAISIAGSPTAGDFIGITVASPQLSGGTKTVSYTVMSGDNLDDVASGLSNAMNADTTLQTLGLSSASSAPAVAETSRKFMAAPTVVPNASTPTVAATDGGGSTATANSNLNLRNTPATQALTYDLNGNLTSDGTNTYQWDWENRLVQINYPGTGNNSKFTYDGLNHLVKITESENNAITSTMQLVRTALNIREVRDTSGTLLRKYFKLGVANGTDTYFYLVNQRGDIVSETSSSGELTVELSYDAYGRPKILSGSMLPDFGFSGLYLHKRSGLNLAVYRAYSPSLGRWIARDPIGERGGANLYSFVYNYPINNRDPKGLFAAAGGVQFPISGGGGGSSGGGMSGAGGGGDPDDPNCRNRAEQEARDDLKESGEAQKIANRWQEVEDQMLADRERELLNMEYEWEQQQAQKQGQGQTGCSKSGKGKGNGKGKGFKPPKKWSDDWRRRLDAMFDAENDEQRALANAYLRKWLDRLGCSGPRPYP